MVFYVSGQTVYVEVSMVVIEIHGIQRKTSFFQLILILKIWPVKLNVRKNFRNAWDLK